MNVNLAVTYCDVPLLQPTQELINQVSRKFPWFHGCYFRYETHLMGKHEGLWLCTKKQLDALKAVEADKTPGTLYLDDHSFTTMPDPPEVRRVGLVDIRLMRWQLALEARDADLSVWFLWLERCDPTDNRDTTADEEDLQTTVYRVFNRTPMYYDQVFPAAPTGLPETASPTSSLGVLTTMSSWLGDTGYNLQYQTVSLRNGHFDGIPTYYRPLDIPPFNVEVPIGAVLPAIARVAADMGLIVMLDHTEDALIHVQPPGVELLSVYEETQKGLLAWYAYYNQQSKVMSGHLPAGNNDQAAKIPKRFDLHYPWNYGATDRNLSVYTINPALDFHAETWATYGPPDYPEEGGPQPLAIFLPWYRHPTAGKPDAEGTSHDDYTWPAVSYTNPKTPDQVHLYNIRNSASRFVWHWTQRFQKPPFEVRLSGWVYVPPSGLCQSFRYDFDGVNGATTTVSYQNWLPEWQEGPATQVFSQAGRVKGHATNHVEVVRQTRFWVKAYGLWSGWKQPLAVDCRNPCVVTNRILHRYGEVYKLDIGAPPPYEYNPEGRLVVRLPIPIRYPDVSDPLKLSSLMYEFRACPNVRTGDSIEVEYNNRGEPICVSPYLDAPLGTIVYRAVACLDPELPLETALNRTVWTRKLASGESLTGWAYCNGAVYGFSPDFLWTTKDLRCRVAVGVDFDHALDLEGLNSVGNMLFHVGDVGGFAWHGVTTQYNNDHPDHPAHKHTLPNYAAVEVQSGTGVTVNSLIYPYETGEVAAMPHKGRFGTGEPWTSNMQPYIALIPTERVP